MKLSIFGLQAVDFELLALAGLSFRWFHFINLEAEGGFTHLVREQTTPVAQGDEGSADHGAHKVVTLVLRT